MGQGREYSPLGRLSDEFHKSTKLVELMYATAIQIKSIQPMSKISASIHPCFVKDSQSPAQFTKLTMAAAADVVGVECVERKRVSHFSRAALPRDLT